MRRHKAEFFSVLTAAVIAIVFLNLAACGSKEKPEIRVGFNTWVGYGPLFIADERGFFAKHGLKVNLKRMEDTGNRRASLAAHRLEAEGSTIDDLILGAAEGVPGKMVLALDQSLGADGILANSDIQAVADLKGKRVAVQPGFVNNFFLLYVLEMNHLSSKDIVIKPMEPDAASVAFKKGQVDAAVTWEPWLSSVRQLRPDGKLLLTSKDVPGVIVDILVFRDDFITQHPEDVEGFVGAWYDALDFLKAEPSKGHEIIARRLGDIKNVGEMLSGVQLLGREENFAYLDRAKHPNAFEVAEVANRLWYAAGYTHKQVGVSGLILSRFAGATE
jgi:NitT/TauT family transport system substrate-binding protein